MYIVSLNEHELHPIQTCVIRNEYMRLSMEMCGVQYIFGIIF